MSKSELLATVSAAAGLFLSQPGTVVEARIPKTAKAGTVSGYFDNAEALAKAVVAWDGKVPAVYVTLNPVVPALLARAANRLEQRAATTTNDRDVVRRWWLLIDCDPKRPAGISSTDAEHAQAHAVAQSIRYWLEGECWPDPVYADSGNGGHLLYKIDLPNDDVSRDMIQRILAALKARYDTDAVSIDETVFNASRISKLYGTMACKGDSTADRPHRRSRIIDLPPHFGTVPMDLLQAIADLAPAPEPKVRPGATGSGVASTSSRPATGNRTSSFDVAAFIERTGLQVAREASWNGSGHKWILGVCPWNPDHTDNSAWVGQQPTGEIAAGCSHNSCKGNDWHALRAMLEPPTVRVMPSPAVPLTSGSNALKPAPVVVAREILDLSIPQSTNDMLKTYVLLHGSSDVWDLRKWKQISVSAVKSAHPKNFSEWDKNDFRAMIDIENLVFDPTLPVGYDAEAKRLNVWRGLPMAPNPNASCDLMVAHLHWLCGEDTAVIRWLTCWLAHQVQRPGVKIKSAVIVHGPQGAGKSILFEVVSRFFGPYSVTIGQDQLNSQYNGWSSGRLFALAEEVATRAELRTLKNKLKHWVTGDKIRIEEKYLAGRDEDNRLQFVFLSNDDMPLMLEDDDRRNLVLRTPDALPKDYYHALKTERDAGGAGAFLHYLLTYDMGDWHPDERPPETDAKRDLKALGRTSSEAFLAAWTGEDIDALPFKACGAEDLYKAYRTWCGQSGEKFIESKTAFGIKSRRMKKQRVGGIDGAMVTVIIPTEKADVDDVYNLASIREQVLSFREYLSAYIKQAQKEKV